MKKDSLIINLRVILFTILHFTVDGLCALLIFSKLYSDNYTASLFVFLAYNTLAFVFQPLVGILADKWLNYKLLLIISFGLIGLAFVFGFNPFIASILLGLGNAFFHISGGKYISVKTNNDIVSLGIFVSTGAMGLFLGTYYYGYTLLYVLVGLFIVCLGILLLLKDDEETKEHKKEPLTKNNIWLLIILLVVVLIRSYVGKAAPMQFEVNNLTLLFITMGVVLGKAMGGLLTKLIGIKWTFIISMVVSIFCLSLGTINEISFVIGMFFFNFTMPITLFYANELFKGKEGFAFGLLAGVLFPGYLLGMIYMNVIAVKIIIVVLSIASLIGLLIVEKRIKHD